MTRWKITNVCKSLKKFLSKIRKTHQLGIYNYIIWYNSLKQTKSSNRGFRIQIIYREYFLYIPYNLITVQQSFSSWMIFIEVRLFSSAEGNGVQIKVTRSLFSVWRSDRTGMKVFLGYLFYYFPGQTSGNSVPCYNYSLGCYL